MRKPKFKINDVVVLKIPSLHYEVYTTITEIKVFGNGEISYFTAFDDNPVEERFITLAEDNIEKPEQEKQELPKTWDEVKAFFSNRPSDKFLSRWAEICNLIEITEYYTTTEFRKHIAFQKLILLRDIYRQGWTPDYTDRNTSKYSIVFLEDKIITISAGTANRVLAFSSEKTRNLFFENFKDLIEECKEFI